MLVPAESVAVDGELDRDDTMTRPFSLDVPVPDGAGSPGSLLGLAYDDVVAEALDAAGVSAGTRAHRATTLLMASWFDADPAAGAGPAAAVLVGPDTGGEALELLSSTLSAGGPLDGRPEGPLGGIDPLDAPGATLLAPPPSDLRGAVDAFERSATSIAGYRSMVGEDDPSAALWSTLNDESLATGLSASERAALHAAVEGGLAGNLAQIELPRPREVILTSEDTTIPLRFTNGLPVEVRMVLRARSPRLDIGMDGTTEIVIVPGDDIVVDVPVTVRASGQTLLRLTLESPDGSIPIGSVDVPVRSTAISGVGAALSIISVLFLVGWWFRTHRRKRREERDGDEHGSVQGSVGVGTGAGPAPTSPTTTAVPTATPRARPDEAGTVAIRGGSSSHG